MTEQKKKPAETVLEALRKAPGSTADELAKQAGLAVSTTRKALADLEAAAKASRTVGGREAGHKLPDTWTIAVAPHDPAPASPAEKGSEDRLPKGKLGQLILEHMRANAGKELSPSAVGKAINHSAGAISNALKKMAEKGEVTEVSAKPKRYSIKP